MHKQGEVAGHWLT